MHSIGTFWLWAGFFCFVISMLAIDMFLLGRQGQHRVSTREALSWTTVWFLCACVFGFLLWRYLHITTTPEFATQKALEFFTGYLIEESLSVDNMFVFIMIFHYFSVPKEYQRKILLYGVIGAIVLRLIMILLGTWLVMKLNWILYLFGAFIVFTGIKMFFVSQDEKELSDNFLLNWLRRHIRMTDRYHGEAFVIKHNSLWYATPMLMVLIMIEFSDLIFALDSIPAIFAITQDPFIIFTSNIFAILGLRALYFLLANMASRFHLLKYGIALILIFIGIKMLISHWFPIPILVALSIVITVLATSIILSLLKKKGSK